MKLAPPFYTIRRRLKQSLNGSAHRSKNRLIVSVGFDETLQPLDSQPASEQASSYRSEQVAASERADDHHFVAPARPPAPSAAAEAEVN